MFSYFDEEIGLFSKVNGVDKALLFSNIKMR